MSQQKPTILIVPGAWHGPEAFHLVNAQLKDAGYKTVGITLPSVGAQLKDFGEDVIRIRAALKEAVEAGEDVLVVAHSYGSIPSNEAIKGLEMKSRAAQGKPGGVVHYFFCCAFVLPEGVSLLDSLGGKDPPWLDVSEDKMTVRALTPKEIFYNDLPEATAKEWISKLSTHSYKTMSSKCSYVAWKNIPSTYLYCLQDKAIPIDAQRGMVAASGVDFKTETLDASHSPFLSMPAETAAAIRRAAGEEV